MEGGGLNMDENVIEESSSHKEAPSHLNPEADEGRLQFYCAFVIICGSARSYCCHCDSSLLLD